MDSSFLGVGDWVNIEHYLVGRNRFKYYVFKSIVKLDLPKCEFKIVNDCLNVCFFLKKIIFL